MGGDDEAPRWVGEELDNGLDVVVIALNLTGSETAADLQRLAEIFEVREALVQLFRAENPADNERLRTMLMSLCDGAAEILHAAGWRPGMTAENAARLLAEAGR